MMHALTPIRPLPAAAAPDPATAFLGTKPTTEESRRTMRKALRRAVRVFTGGESSDPFDFDWCALRAVHVARLKVVLLESGAAPAGVNVCLTAVRGVLATAADLGQYTETDLASVKRVPGAREHAAPAVGRAVPLEEQAALFATCDDTPIGPRDAALLAEAFGGGLRRSEIVGLELADYTALGNEPAALRVLGKGRKPRLVYVGAATVAALTAWLEVRGMADGPLFCGAVAGGQHRLVVGTRLCVDTLATMLARRARAAGVPALTSHDARRSYISAQLDRGIALDTVARLVGHSSTSTTMAYDRTPERRAQAAGASVTVPYGGSRP